ncbi:unnamed protein product (macronuclear) [Paramecium tetraurelia]|uniref:Uncharacterized protein n=1 Tax=Paramecium tetraurelia TaxID=5888 RepID=A0D375_PARTE|nr:uncharacterized protein GSPATT00012977001 [Paramecium tetraurelia]CAK77492.1 unnamed protein product [Paramecium tetraurelia]|eukprot:XP_001444889.1 hypothetical protein (macronuclear) [Paramecium tetraurelia strain d4-2]
MLTDSPSYKHSNKENSPKHCPIIRKSNISHKLINEVLNSGSDYLQDQLEQIDHKIIQYQCNIKQKITTLLGESTCSIDQQLFQNKLQDLRMEEQNYQQMQSDIDKQQSTLYDYYETEFNKLKSQYELVTQEHQQFIKDRGEVHQTYNSILETKAMLKEDLNAKLLQRAELVGQKEELEEFVEQIKNDHPQLTEIVESIYQCDQKTQDIAKNINNITNQIQLLYFQQDEKKKQLSSYNQTTLLEVQVHQQTQKVKYLKNKIVPIQKSLNLQHPDSILNEFIVYYGSQPIHLESIEFQTKLTSFIQQFRNTLFKQGNQGNNWGSMKEFVFQLEQFIFASLSQRQSQNQLSDLKHSLKQYGDEQLLSNEVCTIDYQVEVKKQQIKEFEEEKSQALYRREILYDQFQERVSQQSEEAFQQYQDQNEQELTHILNEFGNVEYRSILDQTFKQMQQLMQDQEEEQFNNTYKVLQQYYLFDQAIKINIQMVDQEILPQLKNIGQSINNAKKELDKLSGSERPYIDRQTKIELDIQYLEQEFKRKIDYFNSQEAELQRCLSATKLAIENTQEQLLSKDKPNKALLEQEILQLNNMLIQLQEQKKQIEASQFQFSKSPQKNDVSRRSSNGGILAISKSLNQFSKLRKEPTVNSFNNSVVKGITPSKESSNLYHIAKYPKPNCKTSQELRLKSNVSLKSIK